MTSSYPDAPRRFRLLLIVVVALLVIVAAAAMWWSHTSATATAGTDTGHAGQGNNTNDGVAILLGLADTAVAEDRLVAPEGANAYEFYLSVLQLDPANAVARTHLQSAFPQASADVERAINANALDEAARELRLLREVDANNYTLSLLAGKLDAQRMIKVREDEARAAEIQARSETRL